MIKKQMSFRSVNVKVLVKVFITAVVCITASLVWADYPIMSQHYAADPTAVEWNGRLSAIASVP